MLNTFVLKGIIDHGGFKLAANKLRLLSNTHRKLVNAAIIRRKDERIFTVKNPSLQMEIPFPPTQRSIKSHILMLFTSVEIRLDPDQTPIIDFQIFLSRLEQLKLPNVRYYADIRNLDDCKHEGIDYLKAFIKRLPQIDKLTITKSLMHSHAFCEMFRKLKLFICTDSHIKFTPFAPQDLQQVIMKNTIVHTFGNFSHGDFWNCKVFALQDCKVSRPQFFSNSLNRKLVEHIAWLDVEVRRAEEFCPLGIFTQNHNKNKANFHGLKTLKVKGNLREKTLKDFVDRLTDKGYFPSLQSAVIHTTNRCSGVKEICQSKQSSNFVWKSSTLNTRDVWNETVEITRPNGTVCGLLFKH